MRKRTRFISLITNEINISYRCKDWIKSDKHGDQLYKFNQYNGAFQRRLGIANNEVESLQYMDYFINKSK